jgi:hypothetical protein
VAEVKEWTEAEIHEIRWRITDLSRILVGLEHLAKTCYSEGPVNECPILEALAGDPHETENQHHKGGVL